MNGDMICGTYMVHMGSLERKEAWYLESTMYSCSYIDCSSRDTIPLCVYLRPSRGYKTLRSNRISSQEHICMRINPAIDIRNCELYRNHTAMLEISFNSTHSRSVCQSPIYSTLV